MAIQLNLLSVRPGAAHHVTLEAIAQDYLQRCGRTLPASARVFRTEAALLDYVGEEKRAGAATFWIADLEGKSLDSVTFAERIREARDNGIRRLMLAIGPANGWSEAGRKAADLRISLGAMTLPHELAWLVLAEQVYRASTILQGHPYHLGH
ncbi:MAG TPA: 23S rRNA (pseudouridine(1915)-N(3))-methyltransferase RlmH [Terriglobus sp.]